MNQQKHKLKFSFIYNIESNPSNKRNGYIINGKTYQFVANIYIKLIFVCVRERKRQRDETKPKFKI